MVHLPHLIQDLALIMAAAAVVTILFKKLKQPVVLGYIIAGVIVGPHFHLFPTVTDKESISIWAEIGVIFLLFSLGLEFSFKKLARVGASASITAIVEVVVMLFAGYATGQLMGWSVMDSIFLGGILSVSSTTIIIRAFDELGVKGKKFAGLVFGILVIEDLVAIVLMVLLTTVAVSKQFAGAEMLFSIGKLSFFLVLWFVAGIFFLPTLLRKARSVMNDEMLLVTSIALCLVMVVAATKAGFSPALGAFIMGSILAETMVGEKIEHLTKSVKDLFGAVFFVSVGMMIDPKMLGTYLGPILLIIGVTIVFKALSTTAGALMSGQPLKQSVQAGMSLAQIGEFSFIIATLGLSLKVISPFLYPIAVAVSAITTFTTPYLIRASGPFYEWLNARIPMRVRNSIERYSASAQAIKATSDWKRVLRSHLVQMAIYAIVIYALILVLSNYVVPGYAADKAVAVRIVIATISILLLLPIFWALALRPIQQEATERLLTDKRYKGPLMMLQLVRAAVAVALIIFLVNTLLPVWLAIVVLVVAVAVVFLARNKLQLLYNMLEDRFFINLNDRENEDNHARGAHLTPWDAHIASFVISPYFEGIGRSLLDLQLREQLGINIARIKRGSALINVPQRADCLYPSDIVFVIGTDDQVDLFKTYLANHTSAATEVAISEQDISLQQLVVAYDSPLAGKTIKESAIRERSHGLVVGIERNNQRLLNPESDTILQPADRLWIVGSTKRIRLLNERQT